MQTSYADSFQGYNKTITAYLSNFIAIDCYNILNI